MSAANDRSNARFGVSTGSALGPPLKWAGGKRWLLPTIAPVWRSIQPASSEQSASQDAPRLVEPFAGGLAIALGLRPERALLNDANAHLINFYRQLQSGLPRRLAMRNDSDLYYAHREAFNEYVRAGRHTSKRAAELFYYLNRTGFNGLCRFNSRGEFNVPFGRYTRINYLQSFDVYRDVLGPWDFQVGDFAALATHPTDVIYADPPYDVQFTRYSQQDFRWDDQVRLAHWLAEHPGVVIASNQATDRIMDLYRDLNFDVHERPAPRRISCNGDRTDAVEIVATRNLDGVDWGVPK